MAVDDILVYLKVLSEDFHGENEENYENIAMITIRADIPLQGL
jgi:hypothetical protein